MAETEQQERRLAENQALFRELNERVEALNENFSHLSPYGSWACECADTSCLERIQMTLGEYEEVRAKPTHFAVLPDPAHVFPDVEDVVRRESRFWVVEKLGAAAQVADGADPRRRAVG